MSDQRVCDLDATIIDPERDYFYTVTDGRTGKRLDICFACARSKSGPTSWAASMPLAVGARIRSSAGLGKWVFDVVTGGTTGPVEPSWPTSPGALVEDGEVVYRVAVSPRENATVRLDMPGTTRIQVSLYGWMEGTNESVS